MNKPELNPEDELVGELEREHLRPIYSFKGTDLWPFTRGTKLIFSQIADDDTMVFRALSFVWIHLKRGEATCKSDMARNVIPFAWDVNKFRAEIMDFRDDLTDEDEEEAMRIMVESFESERKSSVKAGKVDGTESHGQKKTESIQTPSLGPDTASPKPRASRSKS